jgi:hypothetical protein
MSSARPFTNSLPFLVEVTQVAGGHVPVDGLLALAARVPLEQHLVGDVDLAVLPRRQLVAVLVEDPEGGARRRRPARAGSGAQVLGGRDGERGGRSEVEFVVRPEDRSRLNLPHLRVHPSDELPTGIYYVRDGDRYVVRSAADLPTLP